MGTVIKRFVEIDTPLQAGTLLFLRMQAREELGRLSEYQLELLSNDETINLDAVLGKSVTVKLELVDEKVRTFSGYVTRFSLAGMHGRFHRYQATVRPWLWFLTLTTNCRIFQEKKVPEILKEVFEKHPSVADVKFELTESYAPWDYCVQYRESDFAFVSRLMEDEGIYYFFRHHEGRHTLVVADSISAHPVASEERIPFIDPTRVVRDDREQVREWSVTRELQSGKYALTDYDYEKPSVDLQVKSRFPRQHAMSEYEVYDYPGAYVERGDGELYARTRIEELQAKFERVRGATNARGLSTGQVFSLTSHPRADQNAEYLVVSAEYKLKSNEYEASEAGPADYDCRFVALNSQQPFRPERITPKPVVEGPQTAIAVGPPGETIHTDKLGRVKVHFHWNRYSKKDDTSSCWIRVSQNWGGKGWGGMFIPHVGQEVIVQFLEGDPDSPLITGRVYNAENMPPVELPAGKTKSIIRDHGGNEIVMEGAAGRQQIRLHCPKDNSELILGNCITHNVDDDWFVNIGGNALEKIKGSLKKTVHGDVLDWFMGVLHRTVIGWTSTMIGGYKTELIGGYETKLIKGASTAVIKGKKIELISGTTYKIHSGAAREWRNTSNDAKTPEERLKIGQLRAIYKKASSQVDGAYNLKVSETLQQKANEIFEESKDMIHKASNLSVKAGKLEQKAETLLAKADDIKFNGKSCNINDGALTIK